MKRFHVHVAVDDLAASIAFYNKLFGQPPSSQQQDFAKWLLEDPRLHFAISSGGHAAGVNHLGIQADSPEELESLKMRADDASGATTPDQNEAACCDAKSEKHWTMDPQGLAWEQFEGNEAPAAGCCTPLRATEASTSSEPAPACCVPKEAVQNQKSCCG